MVFIATLSGCADPAPIARRPEDSYRRPHELIAALSLKRGDVIAEVGAGGGYLTLRLADAVGRTGRVVATDISSDAIVALRSRLDGRPQVWTRLVDRDEPGLELGTYTLILLSEVDHLLVDRAAYLRKLTRCLGPNGRIAISNAERHRDATLAAAEAASLRIETASLELPGQFVIFLSPPAHAVQ